ncbi:C-type lectin 37Da [Aedes albopictus]|uniref:C-type lectin domain-containing protein n=1 Tax=Aedes albopictus TaxID=7160 RepID=A0ABM2A6G3_AEDAL|nr:C-type lectin 37Da-like [Aedes albopictus]
MSSTIRKLVSLIVIWAYMHVQSAPSSTGKEYEIPNIKANWYKASEICNYFGMQLVTITSRDENDAVARFVQRSDKFSDVACSFWIGGNDLAEEGTFSWMPNGQLVRYANWTPGEPNNHNGTEHCMQIVYEPRREQRWTWNDNKCRTKYMYFICESKPRNCVEELRG